MPEPLTRADLMSLETYASERADFRSRAMAHKKARTVHLGAHLTLVFEDRLTIQYQVQEMLRIERIFEAAGIDEELGAYNPLIPDGENLKATLLIEFTDVEERRRQLVRLRDVEHQIGIVVGDFDTVTAIADEDMPRSNEDKTSAVHFLRFELGADRVKAWRDGAAVSLTCTHPAYQGHCELDAETRAILAADFA